MIAPSGHTDMHVLQELQYSLIKAFSSFITIASKGQELKQVSHPEHFSNLTTIGI